MGWVDAQRAAALALSNASDFFAWLGIHPTTQDFAKALILVAFVLAILMIVGDVYRGEIQNKLHRIKLVATPKKDSPPLRADADIREVRRRARRERDISIHVHNKVIPLTLDKIYSDGLFYLRYRDFKGCLKLKALGKYRTKFRVRVMALGANLAANLKSDHNYTPEELEHLVNEEGASIMSMAGSRVDLLYHDDVERFEEKLTKNYERLQASRFRRWLARLENKPLRKPERVGLLVKFHFPIDPYFLLYRHPDTNVKTTAWLTVLTSVFALFMQLMFAQPGDEEAVRARPLRAQQHAEVGTASVDTATLTSRPVEH